MHLIMVADSLSEAMKFETMIHELTHVADTSATEVDIAKVEDCITRRPDKEKKKPKTGGGGGPKAPSSPGVDYLQGYCEYEGHVRCYTDDNGNDYCWYDWVLLYFLTF